MLRHLREIRDSECVEGCVREYREADAPVTYSLMGLVTGVFAVEVLVTLAYSVDSVETLATGLFGVTPRLAWVLSPVLHRGPLHFTANVVGLFALGLPIERRWSLWRYSGFLLAAAYLSTAAGAVFLWYFGNPPISVYGASGVVFALCGFALANLIWERQRLNCPELVAMLLGAVALLAVAVDPITGPYLDPHWINGTHMSGFVLGAVVGWRRRPG